MRTSRQKPLDSPACVPLTVTQSETGSLGQVVLGRKVVTILLEGRRQGRGIG